MDRDFKSDASFRSASTISSPPTPIPIHSPTPSASPVNKGVIFGTVYGSGEEPLEDITVTLENGAGLSFDPNDLEKLLYDANNYTK